MGSRQDSGPRIDGSLLLPTYAGAPREPQFPYPLSSGVLGVHVGGSQSASARSYSAAPDGLCKPLFGDVDASMGPPFGLQDPLAMAPPDPEHSAAFGSLQPPNPLQGQQPDARYSAKPFALGAQHALHGGPELGEGAWADPSDDSSTQVAVCWEHGCNGRVFSSWSNLRRHQRERSSTQPKCYCPRCGAYFSRTTARNQHMANMSCMRIRRYSNGRVRPILLKIQANAASASSP